MKKRTKIILIIVAILVIGGGYYLIKGRGPVATEYVTETVKTQNLTQTVSATGSIKSAEQIDLNFAAAGRLTEVKVKVGDRVLSGQMLARLDTGDLSVELQRTRASLASAQANLDKVLSGATSETVSVSQEQVASAQVAYSASLVDLENTRKNKTENMLAYQDTARSDLNNYLFKARAALNIVDIDNGNLYILRDHDAQQAISDKNLQYKINAETYYEQATISIGESEVLINQLGPAFSTIEVSSAINSLLNSLSLVSATLDSTFNVILNTSVTYIISQNQTELDALKTSIRTEQTAINTGVSTLQADKSNLQTKELYYDNAIDTAKAVVDQKKQAWDLAQAQYNLTVAPAQASDVANYQALVAQARAQVAAVEQRMSDRIIKAPVAGTVTKVNNSVGEYASMAAPVIVMLGDEAFEIEVDVPESDIAKVTIGNNADITLDAFGEDIPFSGKIILIEPAQTEISGVVYYKVKIALDPTDQDVKPGMTANIDIRTAEKDNILVVPQRAVRERDSSKYVQVMTDQATNQIEERSVVTGLKGDDGLIEVVSGLVEGEVVVTFTKNGK
ncbi:MAG: efflux RND transporter periplasmic adaptor subunit [Patescibacteria group bacterium]